MQALRHKGRAVPANLRPYVKVLGVENAVRFFLTLGGSQVYLARSRTQGGMVTEIVGEANVIKLCDEMVNAEGQYVKVPLARRWIAEVMYLDGKNANEIARTVRADVSTVRRWLDAPGKSAA